MMRRLVLVCVLGFPALLVAHDTWIIPSSFRPKPGSAVRLRLATGEAFPASEVAATPDRVARYTIRDNARVRKIADYRVEGEFLAAETTPELQGDAILALELKPRLLEMPAKEFDDYLRAERQTKVIQLRAQRGAAGVPGRERYGKIAKSVLCVGDGDDSSSILAEGLLLEILPEQSPCLLRAWDRLEVLIFYESKPVSNARVVAGYEGATGHNYPVETRTDADGRAGVTLSRPGPWFIRVLHMVPAVEDPQADWHSVFSTLTFDIKP